MDMIEKPRAEAGEEPRMRADARRSRAKLLDAATTAFAENGADAPLEDIARRAGVGIESSRSLVPLDRLELQRRDGLPNSCEHPARLGGARSGGTTRRQH